MTSSHTRSLITTVARAACRNCDVQGKDPLGPPALDIETQREGVGVKMEVIVEVCAGP